MKIQSNTVFRKLRPAAAIASALLLTGCVTGGYDTFAYHEIHEIPQGAGLISGNAGDYTISVRDLTNLGGNGSSSSHSSSAPATPKGSLATVTTGTKPQ
jgi:hypothetical protein